MTPWVLLLVPVLVLPIVLLLSFAGCQLVAPLDDHVAATPTDPKVQAPHPHLLADPSCSFKDGGFTVSGTVLDLYPQIKLTITLRITGTTDYECSRPGSQPTLNQLTFSFPDPTKEFPSPDATQQFDFPDGGTPPPGTVNLCKPNESGAFKSATVAVNLTLTQKDWAASYALPATQFDNPSQHTLTHISG
jgi:hypothetical protein